MNYKVEIVTALIAADISNGTRLYNISHLTIQEAARVAELILNNVDDHRTLGQKARQEMGMTFQECER